MYEDLKNTHKKCCDLTEKLNNRQEDIIDQREEDMRSLTYKIFDDLFDVAESLGIKLHVRVDQYSYEYSIRFYLKDKFNEIFSMRVFFDEDYLRRHGDIEPISFGFYTTSTNSIFEIHRVELLGMMAKTVRKNLIGIKNNYKNVHMKYEPLIKSNRNWARKVMERQSNVREEMDNIYLNSCIDVARTIDGLEILPKVDTDRMGKERRRFPTLEVNQQRDIRQVSNVKILDETEKYVKVSAVTNFYEKPETVEERVKKSNLYYFLRQSNSIVEKLV